MEIKNESDLALKAILRELRAISESNEELVRLVKNLSLTKWEQATDDVKPIFDDMMGDPIKVLDEIMRIGK